MKREDCQKGETGNKQNLKRGKPEAFLLSQMMSNGCRGYKLDESQTKLTTGVKKQTNMATKSPIQNMDTQPNFTCRPSIHSISQHLYPVASLK